MKIIKVEHKGNVILELQADDMTNISNAIHHYLETSDRKEELKNELKNIRAILLTCNNICQYGQPLVESTHKIINDFPKCKGELGND